MKNPTQLKKEIYLRNVARRWKSELDTNKKVYILSPYITSKTAENVLEKTKNCEIYTDFNIENYLIGASSINTLKNLVKKGFKVYSIPQLHAKIILISDAFVSIGSQNLTNQGTKNKEATFTSTSSEIVKFIEEELKENWFSEREEISLEMLEDLEKIIKPLKKRYKKFTLEIKKVEEELKEREKQRINERQKQADYQKRLRELKTKLEEIEKTHEYVRGSIDVKESESWNGYSSVWTFIPSSNYGSDLLSWRIGVEKINLIKTFRYLSIIETSGKLAWARVMKTRITKYEKSVSWNNSITLNEKTYSVVFTANWNPKTLPEYNIEIVLEKNAHFYNREKYQLLIWFDLAEIKIHKIKSLGVIGDLLDWIEDNQDEFKVILIERLLKSFKYVENLSGVEANSFLEKGKTYELRVRRIETQKFLSFKEIR
jgi:hypothetical protein